MKYLFLLSALLLFSCTRPADEPESDALVFHLQLPPALEVHSRGGALGGITISDVWVAQFNASSGVLIQCHNFSGSAIGSTETNQTIEVKTSAFSKENSTFYIIANAGTDLLNGFSGTESDLQSLTKPISTAIRYDLNLLSCGPLAYTPTTDKVVLVAPLKRAYAKVSLQWSAPAEVLSLVSITSVKVVNLPKSMALYTRGGGSLSVPYPSSAAENFNTGDTSATSDALPANTPNVFYMGENLRGMGTGTTFAQKNLPVKGPGGTLDYCTYLVLNGEYRYFPSATPILVDYKIYLGGNLMNDYNIQRGMFYDVTVMVNGANSADVRVTITDGNVIVFDKVEEISNTVDF